MAPVSDSDVLVSLQKLIIDNVGPAVRLRARYNELSKEAYLEEARRILSDRRGVIAPAAAGSVGRGTGGNGGRGGKGGDGNASGGRGSQGGGRRGGRGGNHVASADAPPGFIFFASGSTYKECLERSLFGLHKRDLAGMMNIRRSTPLFLLNFSHRVVYGPFAPASDASMNIEPLAWQTAQRGGGKGRQARSDESESPYPAEMRVCRDGAVRKWQVPNDLKYQLGRLERDQVRSLLAHLSGSDASRAPEADVVVTRSASMADAATPASAPRVVSRLPQQARSSPPSRTPDGRGGASSSSSSVSSAATAHATRGGAPGSSRNRPPPHRHNRRRCPCLRWRSWRKSCPL